jgi:hypothetical protein
MHVSSVKTKQMSRKLWSTLLVGVLLASLVSLVPAAAQASTAGWPHFFGRSVLPGFWITGEVTTVEDGSVTLVLPNHHDAHGMMRFISLQVKLDVDDNSVLLNGDLTPLDVSTLGEGDEVVVVPRFVWGNLVAKLIYAGDPEKLADASYRGELVSETADSLTLKNGRDGEFTVQVDDKTIWYEDEQMTRPAELAEGIPLRVLGAESEDENGDMVIHAVLITPVD